MLKLAETHVLISGMNGLGAEVAKNVILANVGSVVIHDEHKATKEDLGSHFYLTEASIGHNRADACVQQFRELNPDVQVHAAKGSLLSMFANADIPFDIVVLIDVPVDVASLVNSLCRHRQPAVKFIFGGVNGLFGYAFSDFGDKFTVIDSTGETIKTAVIESITNGNPTVVQCVAEQDLDFADGDYVTLSEVKGIPELNGREPVKINNVFKGRKRFDLMVDSSGYGKHTGGGIAVEKRQPVELHFRSLADALVNPGQLIEVDGAKAAPSAVTFGEAALAFIGQPEFEKKFGRVGLLHLANRALMEYRLRHAGNYPEGHVPSQWDEVVAIANEINSAADQTNKVEELDDARLNVIKSIARGARSVLNPLAALFGGVIGQEVVKAASNKYTPLNQWLYFDALECGPSDISDLKQFEVHGTRYDNQIRVFGADFQKKIASQDLFMVGAGALGCEYLKNLALMGVGTGSGSLTVTDDDIIEKSNLSRQFLFRNFNVGHSKSESATKAIHTMNRDVKIHAFRDRVSPETEGVFNDQFWLKTSFVVNALDNVNARLYVDGRCVTFGKALFEAGTLGPKCNVQVILPFKTESYGSTADPPEKEAPQCAIHNFPHNIDHCLGLARSEFVGNFETVPTDSNKFIEKGPGIVAEWTEAGENPNSILDKLVGDIKVNCGMDGGMKDLLISNRPSSFEDCVRWARLKFESYFVNRIKQLTFNFPADAVTSKGQPFWSPPKRFPVIVPFNPQDPIHMQFIIAASNLRAKIGGIGHPMQNRDPRYFEAILSKVHVPEYVPKADATIKTDDEAEDEARRNAATPAVDITTELPKATELIKSAVASLKKGFKLHPEEFEKDNDENFHIDFIASFGNLRARNYAIDEVDTLTAKLKAGRIIPAIATATAVATGLASLEIYKYLAGKDLADHKNSFINLGINIYAVSDPVKPKKIVSRTEIVTPDPQNHPDYQEEMSVVAYPEGHTIWDSIVIKGAAKMSLKELIAHIADVHKITLESWAVMQGKKGVSIYSSVMASTKENLGTNVVQLIETKGGLLLKGRAFFVLEANFVDEDDNEVEAARVLLKL